MIHLCTLFDKRFLLQGLTMMQSVDENTNSKTHWSVLALDEEAHAILLGLEKENITVYTLETLGDTELYSLIENRPWNELCWTSAACLLRKINMHNEENDISVYIDADIYFYYDIELLLAPIRQNANILVHEHDFSNDRAEWLQKSGRFNVGVVAGKKSLEFNNCLTRWREQVLDNCEVNPEFGKCGDQTYLNEWPALYSTLAIMPRSSALGPWNVNRYEIAQSQGRPIINFAPVVFYHFHGLETSFVGNLLAFYAASPGVEFISTPHRQIYKPYVRNLRGNISLFRIPITYQKKRRMLWHLRHLIKNRLGTVIYLHK
jgi:hypothetical protein